MVGTQGLCVTQSQNCLQGWKAETGGQGCAGITAPAAMPASLVVAKLTKWPGTFRRLANVAYTAEGTSSASAAHTALVAVTTVTFWHQPVQATPKAAPVPTADSLFTRAVCPV